MRPFRFIAAIIVLLLVSWVPSESASIDEAHTAVISRLRPYQAEFSIPAEQLLDAAFRLRVMSPNASAVAPVLIGLQHRESVESWIITAPLATVARTLCPPMSLSREFELATDWELLTLTIATQSARPVLVEFSGQLMSDFTVTPGSSVSFTVESADSPQLLAIRVASGPAALQTAWRLAFRAAPSIRCALVQLHQARCPLSDPGSSVISAQTLTGSGYLLVSAAAATIRSANSTLSTYFLTVRTFPDGGGQCGILDTGISDVGGGQTNFSLTVQSLPVHAASLPVALTAGCLLLLLLLAPVCARICWKAPGPAAVSERNKARTSPEANYELGSPVRDTPVDTVDRSQLCTCRPLPDGVVSLEDVISDAVDAADGRRQTRYCVHAAVAAVFFCLPALQLVMSSQRLLHESGDQDLCYYNFACLLPVTVLGHVIYASNSVFSNIGYAILGVTFLICTLVHRRSMKARRLARRRQLAVDSGGKFGVPHSHGLHFASGLCMCVEGLLSAGYHLCPSAASFQFDTAFMLVLASLLALLALAKRRPGLRPPAHWGCLTIAGLLLLNSLGSSVNSESAIRAAVFAATGMLLLTPPVAVVAVRCARLRSCRGSVSLAEVAYGCIWLSESAAAFAAAYFAGRGSAPVMSASYSLLLLACLLTNTACYLAYYLAKKLQSWARTPRCEVHRSVGSTIAAASASTFCLTVALAAWGVALWQFSLSPTDWKLSPAQSRSARNRPCAALGFFDAHDL
ncbi:hypothetical protein BOX15_Mlig005979g1 [Macrostomum lignano]|uniref:Uncharacterized protein n=2 Tax=Macrostomum lignano TaxID=282301 RepID=A0A267GWI1_9PLAT|nr:hypothetical protein BOX15_Mlig005979g1 [Macrostomum lignano]